MSNLKKDTFWMRKCLELAHLAEENNEVPVGALIVKNNQLVSTGYNQTINQKNPIAHAEIIAINQACEKLNNYRLLNCTLYVSLEPCCMCAGAIINARIKRTIFAAYDARVGAAGSVFNILGDARQYYHPEIIGGVEREESEKLLKDFFIKRRKSALKNTP